jgi:hypothetical protein
VQTSQSLEEAFECENVGSDRSEVAEEFNVGVVQKIVDGETDPKRRTEVNEVIRRAKIDDFHINALIAVDDGRKPHQVIIDALDS